MSTEDLPQAATPAIFDRCRILTQSSSTFHLAFHHTKSTQKLKTVNGNFKTADGEAMESSNILHRHLLAHRFERHSNDRTTK